MCLELYFCSGDEFLLNRLDFFGFISWYLKSRSKSLKAGRCEFLLLQSDTDLFILILYGGGKTFILPHTSSHRFSSIYHILVRDFFFIIHAYERGNDVKH